MLKQDYIYISNIYNMIVYETEYDKLFEKRIEIINYQRLIFTFYNEIRK